MKNYPSLSPCSLTVLKYFYIVSKQLSFFYHKCQYLSNIYQANNLSAENQLPICLQRVNRTGISRHAHIYRCFFYSLLQVNPSKLGEYFYSHYQFLFTLHCPTILNLSPPPPPHLFFGLSTSPLGGALFTCFQPGSAVKTSTRGLGNHDSNISSSLSVFSAVSLLFLLSRIFCRPDIILPDCLPFPLLSKKTGAKADRFPIVFEVQPKGLAAMLSATCTCRAPPHPPAQGRKGMPPWADDMGNAQPRVSASL